MLEAAELYKGAQWRGAEELQILMDIDCNWSNPLFLFCCSPSRMYCKGLTVGCVWQHAVKTCWWYKQIKTVLNQTLFKMNGELCNIVVSFSSWCHFGWSLLQEFSSVLLYWVSPVNLVGFHTQALPKPQLESLLLFTPTAYTCTLKKIINKKCGTSISE